MHRLHAAQYAALLTPYRMQLTALPNAPYCVLSPASTTMQSNRPKGNRHWGWIISSAFKDFFNHNANYIEYMQKRLNEIDGLRGWASLVVLTFHMTWEMFGSVFPVYRLYFLRFFLDGSLAVGVFFVLSGDALSNGFLANGNYRSLVRLVMKRYFRLAGPILLSCSVVYLLLKLNMSFSHLAARIVGSEDWLAVVLPFDASFFPMLDYGLIRVFTEHSVDISYNPFLWPMSTELYGSFFIFGILFSFRHLKRPLFIVAAIAGYLWILGSIYSLFFVGLCFSILRTENFFEKVKKSPKARLSFLGLFLLVVADALLTLFNFTSLQVLMLMAASIVFLVYSNENLISFFSNKLSRYLGRISFPLYLCQFSVIISYTSWITINYRRHNILDFSHSILIVISSIFVTFIVAEIFARIEKWYLGKLNSVVTGLLNSQDCESGKVNPSSG